MARKVAYVTGGMGGIGTAMCQRLHRDGFTVIAGCGPSRDFEKWLGEQKAQGYSFYASVGNVGDWDSTVAAFQKAKSEHGPVDVLVNNAGITRDGMLTSTSTGPSAASTCLMPAAQASNDDTSHLNTGMPVSPLNFCAASSLPP